MNTQDLGDRVRLTIAGAVVDALNDALKLDKEAISDLFLRRVRVNENLAHHPTIQVRQHSGSEGDMCPDCGIEGNHDKGCIRFGDLPPYQTIYSMGLLGLINGAVGPDRLTRRGSVIMSLGKKKNTIDRFQLSGNLPR